MKKFIMATPQQGLGKLVAMEYEPQGNSKLFYADDESSQLKATRFPIVPLLNGYADSAEPVRLITVTYDIADCFRNLGFLEEELAELKDKRGIECTLDSIVVPFDDSVPAALNVFLELIDRIEDEDTLYACVTYGSKLLSITLINVLRYAYKIKHAEVDCMVYGQVNRSGEDQSWSGKIYDITRLLILSNFIDLLSAPEAKPEDPQATLAKILKH